MKATFLSLLAIVSTFNLLNAQQGPPKTEFTITVSDDVLTLKAGETKEITVSLGRSKGFIKSKAELGVSSTLTEGISVTFDERKGLLESTVARIATSNTVKPGTYMIIINCQINHKNKGATVKLIVDSPGESNAGL
jgi:hypothetical protein